MLLRDLWNTSPAHLVDKHVQQIISFAGEGKLRDGNTTSGEFRELLSHVPSLYLKRYADECLAKSFDQSGLALQDVINEVGRRLGFTVSHGRYQGVSGEVGFDGLWACVDPKPHTILIEVKTTDAYRIDLEKIAGYRRALAERQVVREEGCSFLIVVGREDTGGLEAQIRGSRHAWDMRLISVDALLRVMELKEKVEDPTVLRKVRDILIPREFTRLDEIIEIVFAAAEDVDEQASAAEPEPESETGDDEDEPSLAPVAFHEACVSRISAHLGCSFLKQSKVTYSSADGQVGLVCAISKTYENRRAEGSWFAFHPHQKEFLESMPQGYAAFGCGSEKTIVLIPVKDLTAWLDGMNVTSKPDRMYWHVSIFRDPGGLTLHRRKHQQRIELMKYQLKP